MTAQSPNADIDDDREGTDEGGFDLEAAREWAGFIWRAGGRRPKLAIVIFLAVAGLGIAISLVMPRTYNSQVKLLVQADLVGPALSNPGRNIPHDADSPARNVADMIMRRDNLIALVKETNLVDRWTATRPWALRKKDELSEIVNGPLSEEDRVRSLAQTLEKRLTVTADDATMTIGVDWQDPQVAYELVTLVQKNFVESRYDAAVTAIEDAIHVLEDHVKSEGDQVDTDLKSYQAAIDVQNGSRPVTPSASEDTPTHAVAVARSAPPPSAPDPELAKALEEKQRQIHVLQEQHDRELEEVKQQLLQAQLTLTPQHPTVIALQQRADALSNRAPDLLLLKSEERALLAQIALASAPTGTGTILQMPPGAAPSPRPTSNTNNQRIEEPRTAAARAQLEASMRRYQDVIARLDSARLELDITRTTYRYRYSVVTPAEVSRGPTKKTPQIVGAVSLIAGVVLALLGAAAADYQSGRVIEAWQVRRKLKIDLIGELDLPV